MNNISDKISKKDEHKHIIRQYNIGDVKSREDRDRKVLALKNDGYKTKTIREIFGIRRETVMKILQRTGYEDKRVEKIKEMRAKNVSIIGICAELQISRQTYYNLLKRRD